MACDSDAKVKELSAQEHFANVADVYEQGTGGSTRVIARHLIDIASPVGVNSKILDNACGTGVVIDELLTSISDESVKKSLLITAADAAQPMIDRLEAKAEAVWNLPPGHVNAIALASEDLDSLPSDEFDYSFTNFGILFFKDAHKSATHIYRTLRPGGKAFVTTWNDLGYFRAVEQAGREIRPAQPTPKLPLDPAWFSDKYLKEVLQNAGFEDVKIHQMESSYTSTSVDEMAQTLVEMMGAMLKMQGWSDEEVKKLPQRLTNAIKDCTEILFVDENEARLTMVANVAVCKK